MLCVTDADVRTALADVTAGRSIGGRPVQVTQVALKPVPRQCAMLYTSGLATRDIAPLVDGLAGASVLSVGDSSEFTRRGGVIHLYLEDGHMRFAVNVAAAEKARLRISAKLLNLARIVEP